MTPGTARPLDRSAAGTAEDASPLAGSFLIDAHVHCHDCFAQASFLDAAAAGFAAAARGRGIVGPAIGWLLFAEMRGEHYFDALRTGQVEPAGWLLTPTLEDRSLSARRQDGQTMILVAGRQLTTREGLEVLAIGTRTPLADGLPLDETLARIRAADAVPVLPWGFGKWWGKRGTLVDRVLERDDEPFCLGDNGGRLQHGLPPRAFGRAQERGIPVLPGSDPLARRTRSTSSVATASCSKGSIPSGRRHL